MGRVVVFLLLAAGCSSGTTVTVNVLSDGPLTLQRLDAQVQIDDPTEPTSEDLPFSPGALRLPTRITLPLSHDVAANVIVTLIGSDVAGHAIRQSQSTTSVPHADVVLTFTLSGSAVTDGGVPNTVLPDGGGTGGNDTPDMAMADMVTPAPADPCLGCNAPKLCCNKKCVDPSSDVNNCGACGNVCGSGLCGATLSSAMTSGVAPASWSFNTGKGVTGGALYDTAAKLAVITTDTSTQSGSIVYKDPIVTDTFDAHFDFRMSTAGGIHADGIAFILIKNDGTANIPTAAGISGSGLGFVNAQAAGGVTTLNGFAVELDTYDNDTTNMACGETVNGDHVAIDTFAPCSTAGGTVPTPLSTAKPFTLVDGNWHTVHVTLAAGKLSVGITQGANEVSLLSGVTLTGFSQGSTYYFGFSGGTGTFSERAELRNVSVVFPTARCL